MSDPHIDIDEVDNSDPAFNIGDNATTADGIPTGEPGIGFNPSFTEFATGFFNFLDRFRNQSNFGTGGSFDPLPYESRQHFRNSQREFLLGWRTIIDESIRRLDEREVRDNNRQSAAPASERSRAGTKIEIEEIED